MIKQHCDFDETRETVTPTSNTAALAGRGTLLIIGSPYHHLAVSSPNLFPLPDVFVDAVVPQDPAPKPRMAY